MSSPKPTHRRVGSVAVLGLLLLSARTSHGACTFSSGSTGADGDFIPINSMPSTGYSVDGSTVTVTNKSDGIFHFKSINISTNWTVKFTRNVLNTPVFLLAQSNVTVSGAIDVSSPDVGSVSTGGLGGPGGFDGGSSISFDASHGFGPGGSFSYYSSAGYAIQGYCNTGNDPRCGLDLDGWARVYGVVDILPMIGGSGGGGFGTADNVISAGSGGGGAILIASSMTQSITGAIYANAGYSSGGGQGSGGSIRLIANTITGDGTIQAIGLPSHIGNLGSVGRIRLEACTILRKNVTSPLSTEASPGVVFLTTNPTIRITSIGSQSASWPPGGSLTSADIVIGADFTSPVTVSVLASNVTPQTSFRVVLTPAYGTNIAASGTLSGNYAASTGSVSIVCYTNRAWRVHALIDSIPRP